MQKTFLVKVKKSEVRDRRVVPFHAEITFVRDLDDSSWEALNGEEKVVVRKREKGDYIIYEIESAQEIG